MNKKLIFSLLLPAAMVACNNDEFVNDFAVENPAGEVVENLTLNVKFGDGAESRGAYAGSENSLYSNFYLSPEWNSKAIALSDNMELKGDMLGFCLTNGANAITNLPFFIAGYGSTIAETENAKQTVYTFSTQDADETGYNKLYDLGLDAKAQTEAVSLNGNAAKDAFDAAVTALSELEGNEALDADKLDLRQAILKTNAGVMTGEYIAYYPHVESFVDPAGIPAVGLDDLTVIEAEMETSEAEALAAVNFMDKLFAVSQSKIAVDGGSKSSTLTLAPLTSLFVVELYNSNKEVDEDDAKVKRVTVESEQGFILNGRVALNNLGTIVAEENGTTDLVGIAFEPTEISAEMKKGEGLFVAIPYYPNAAKSDLVVTYYKTDGTAASVTINNVATSTGKVLTIRRDYADLEFKAVTRKVFTEDDLKDEVTTAGTLQLMANITAKDLTIAKDIVIEGNNKTLTINNDQSISAINNKLVCGEGVTLALNGTAINADLDVEKLVLTYADATSIAKNIKADELVIKTGSNVTLTDAEIGTLTIEKDAEVTFNCADDKAIEVATVNNSGNLIIAAGADEETINVATVTTMNNKAGSTLTVNENAELVATTVTNDAAIGGTTPVVAAELTVTGELNCTTVNNAGEMTWSSVNDIDMTLNNAATGSLSIEASCNLTGELNNEGDVTLEEDCVVKAAAGALNVNGGEVTVNGSLSFSGTGKMKINAGVVNSVGTVNGANYIEVAEGAEFIRTVIDKNNFLSALGTANIAARFTGVRVAADLNLAEEGDAAVIATKKIYLSNSLTVLTGSELADVVVEGTAVTLTSTSAKVASIEVLKDAALTVGKDSYLEVSGTITNNGTYVHDDNVVVNCGNIAGAGTWTSEPNY